MTEEERRFKIQKKISYEEQLSKEEKQSTLYTITLGLLAISIIINGSLINQNEMDIYSTIIAKITVAFEGIFSSINLKVLIEAITKKTILENEIRNTVDELKIAEIEEKSKGMKK